MGSLGDIQHDVVGIRRLLEDEDGQEEAAEGERIEYHEARTREQEELRAREQK